MRHFQRFFIVFVLYFLGEIAPVFGQPTSTDSTQLATLQVVEKNPFSLVRSGNAPSRTTRSKSLLKYSFTPSKPKQKNVQSEQSSQLQQVQQQTPPPTENIPNVDTSLAALQANNPFSLSATRPKQQKTQRMHRIVFNPEAGAGTRNIEKRRRTPVFTPPKVNPVGTLRFAIILTLLGFLAFLTASFRTAFHEVFRAATSLNLLNLLYRDRRSILYPPYLLLYVLFVLALGSFIYLAVQVQSKPFFENGYLVLLACVSGVGGYFFLKHLILWSIGEIFPVKSEIGLYSFIIGISNICTGIALVPIVLFLAFSRPEIQQISLYAGGIAIALIYTLSMLRALLVSSQVLLSNKFHFFVYLCAVEIAPILILLKLANF